MESYWRDGLHGLSVNEICRRARDRGEVRAAIDPDLAAHSIDTQLGTGLYLMAAGEDPAQVRAQVELAFASLQP